MSTPIVPCPPTVAIALPGRVAYEQTAAERASIDLATLPQYGLNASYAVSVARNTTRRLEPFRDEIATLPGFDMAHLDNFPVYADALEYADAVVTSRARRMRELPELADEGRKLRQLLLDYAVPLSHKDIVPKEVIAELRPGSGYHDLVDDLNALVVLYAERPEVLGPGSPVSPAEVERARQVARTMSHEFGIDEEGNLTQATLLRERARVGWLLIRSNGQLRRAMDYLRYDHGDAAELVPSLYPGGKPGRSRSAKQPEPDPRAELEALHDSFHGDDPHAHAPAIDPELNPFID